MNLYPGLLEISAPDQTRIFGEIDGKLIDVNLAYAAYLTQVQGKTANAYEPAAFWFPQTIAEYLTRSEAAQKSLDEVVAFVRRTGVIDLGGPAGEKMAYDAKDIRWMPPFEIRKNPSSSAFPTARASKRYPSRRSPPAFTSCRKPLSLAARRSSSRNSRKKSTPTRGISVNSKTTSSPHGFSPVK